MYMYCSCTIVGSVSMVIVTLVVSIVIVYIVKSVNCLHGNCYSVVYVYINMYCACTGCTCICMQLL